MPSCAICQFRKTKFFHKINRYPYYQCPRCMTLFLHPKPTLRQIANYYKKSFKYPAGETNEKLIRARAKLILNNLNKIKEEIYILKEVQRIYVSQGVDIHDKHIEVIIQKMFSRMRIKEEGDSNWVKGEIVEWSIFQEEFERLKNLKKATPVGVQILLGISEVALASESFLSAASFQQTSRVLIKAALEGKEDKLRGLKENVIIGKLIPVGTGFRKK